jgi:uncharacterized cupin superfamily protein
MATREATCHCGQLRLEVEGDPFVVSMCHCLACQRRTGSAFALQAAFKPDQVQVHGRHSDYTRVSDEADSKEHAFHFCPECGSQVFYTEPDEPELIVVSVGSFADPSFPPPTESGYEWRRLEWLPLPETIERDPVRALWDPVRPLYEAGAYEEAADRGREILEANEAHPYLLFNLACCESRAGRTTDALEHLEQAVAMWDGCRDMAREDSDFDPIRDEPRFQELMAQEAPAGDASAVDGATLERTENGLVPKGAGWFVVNAREAPWWHSETFGSSCVFEGDTHFREVGVNIQVLSPGEPNCMYHGENAQEDFLVLFGECLLLVEGEERRLRQWDFVHCPAWTQHVFVGAGDGPCAIVMIGARPEHEELLYPVAGVARKHGAGVEKQTSSGREAYARFPRPTAGPYRDGTLPSLDGRAS